MYFLKGWFVPHYYEEHKTWPTTLDELPGYFKLLEREGRIATSLPMDQRIFNDGKPTMRVEHRSSNECTYTVSFHWKDGKTYKLDFEKQYMDGEP